MPWNAFGPANVPLPAQCTATCSPSATMSCTSKRKSGIAPKNSAQYARSPAGPATSTPSAVIAPSGAQAAAIASRSWSARASKYAVMTSFGAAMPGQ